MIYAKRFVKRSPKFIRETSTIEQISKVMAKSKTSGIPVVDQTMQLIGFISERDVINAIAKHGLKELTAKDIMRKEVLTVEEDTPLEYVSKLFSEYSFRHLPVTRGGRVVGMINRKDVISNLLSHYY